MNDSRIGLYYCSRCALRCLECSYWKYGFELIVIPQYGTGCLE